MTDPKPNGSIHSELPTELPPVEPPSARFIVQLFVIPAAIVLVLVVAYVALVQLPFGRLANGGRDVMDYVRSIKSDNENRRWRSAHELASLIHNDAKLASDGALLGELTVLLNRELDHPKKEKPELAQYLAMTLGSFQTLKAKPVEGETPDPIASLCRALGPEQPPAVRIYAALSLSRQAEREGGSFGDERAVRALAQAAEANAEPEDAEVRARASYCARLLLGR